MSSEFIRHRINAVEFFTATNLDNTGFIKHFFSTRIGGVSTGAYESLNLGIYTDDNTENVQSNMNTIFTSVEMNRSKITYLKQIHSDKFFIVNKDNYMDIRGASGDALITSDKGIAIGIFTADCVPIVLFDKEKKIAAVIHAGWKGTALNISGKVLKYMKEILGTDPRDIVAAIGPSIGPCCFEVGSEVAGKFNYVYENDNKLYVDLWTENIKQITECGVMEDKISSSRICTSCSSNLVFSYRKKSGNTGRMGIFVEIQ